MPRNHPPTRHGNRVPPIADRPAHPAFEPRDPIRTAVRPRAESTRLLHLPKPVAGTDKKLLVLLDAIEEASPLSPAHRRELKHDVSLLWRSLTIDRDERKADYIGNAGNLSAYIRFFLPWNVVRLASILPSCEFDLEDGSVVSDIGSGPLTFPIALLIARPDLAGKRLVFQCQDRVKRVLETGMAIFDCLRLKIAPGCAWEFRLEKGSFPFDAPSRQAMLVSAVNVFNESFWKDRSPLSMRARELSGRLASLADPRGYVFVVEPGDPRSGSLVSALRESFIVSGWNPAAPCPHGAACPMPGIFHTEGSLGPVQGAAKRPGRGATSGSSQVKGPWCHFVLSDEAVPDRLAKFSGFVGLPKERLVASWCFLRGPGAAEQATVRGLVRLVSDAIRLPGNRSGRYACSSEGYTLVTGAAAGLPSGSLIEAGAETLARDAKSGARIVETGNHYEDVRAGLR